MFALYAALGQGCAACGASVETVRAGLEGRLCLACRQELPPGLTPLARLPEFVDAGWSAGGYSGLLGGLVRGAKYGGREDVLRALGAFVGLRAATHPWPRRFDGVVAVPGTLARRLQRGVDPVEVLAAGLPAAVGAPRVRALRRTSGLAQAGQSHAARVANVRGAYASTRAVNGHLLLVDDVLTTGATASACALALREAGAEAVSLLVLAAAAGGVQSS